MVEVLGPDRVRVEVDAAEVGDPGQPGRVVDDDLVGGPAGRERQRRGPDEVGHVLRRPLLEERLPGGAVDEPLERHRPAAGAAQRAVGDGQVVVDEVELRVAGLREVDLPRVRDRDLAPVDPEDLLFRRHADTIHRRRRGQGCRVRRTGSESAYDQGSATAQPDPTPACLVIADITGYTSYLAGVELDHAQDILADLIDTVVAALRGRRFGWPSSRATRRSRYAITDTPRCTSTLMDTGSSGPLRVPGRRLRDIAQASQGDCNACTPDAEPRPRTIPQPTCRVSGHPYVVIETAAAGGHALGGTRCSTHC